MNPVSANMVSHPGEYRYSSYSDFVNKSGIANESVIKKLFGNNEKYIDLFEFIHLTFGEGIEYIDDSRMCTISDSKKIIKEILYKFNLSESELKDTKIKNYLYRL